MPRIELSRSSTDLYTVHVVDLSTQANPSTKQSSDLVHDFILRQTLVRMEGNELAVDNREAWAAMVTQALHEEQIGFLTRMHRVTASLDVAWLHHLAQLVLLDCTMIHDIVHRPIPSEMTLEFEGLAQDRANNHSVPPPASSHLRLRTIPVGLLCQVTEVYPQAKHVAFVPLVLLGAESAIVFAECCAQAFPS